MGCPAQGPMTHWARLPSRALGATRALTVALTLALIAGAWVIRWVWNPPAVRPVPVVPIIVLLALWALLDVALLTPRRHAAYRYRVDDHVLEVRRGVVIVNELLVPLSQVLYVETRQGPLVRLLGLTTVRVGTVGSTHDIGPLTPEAAEALAEAVGRR